MVVARILVLLAIICTSRTAWAFEADRVCTLENGRRVRIDDELCRPIGGQLTPTPSPSPTPKPTIVADCADGSFVAWDPKARELHFGDPRKGGVIYQPGRTYHLCFTLPASAQPFFFLESVNHANAACNLYGLWLVAPDGTTYTLPKVVQPGVPPLPQAGKWQVVLLLDEHEAPCASPVGLSMTIRGY